MVAPMRGNRRDRRNEAAQLAKDFMHLSQQGGGPDWPWVLSLLGLALSAIFFVLIHSEGAVIFSLVIAFGSLTYIGIHILPRWTHKRLSAIKGWIALWIVVTVIILLVVGVEGWPVPTYRYLSEGGKASLASYIGHDPFAYQQVRVDYVTPDMEAYRYAEDFVSALQDGHWKVEPPHAVPIIVDRPFIGVQVWYGDKDEQAANALADALRKIKVQEVDLRRMPFGAALEVVVGPKP